MEEQQKKMQYPKRYETDWKGIASGNINKIPPKNRNFRNIKANGRKSFEEKG